MLQGRFWGTVTWDAAAHLGGTAFIPLLSTSPLARDLCQGTVPPGFRLLSRVVEPWSLPEARDFVGDLFI